MRNGTYFILVLNLLMNLALIAIAVFNIAYIVPLFKFNFNLEIIVVMGFYGLMGLPFVLGGFWGAYMLSEPNVRVYLFYLWTSFAFLIIIPAIYLAAKNPCTLLLPKTMQSTRGSAQACGNVWLAIYGVGALVAGVIMYLIFTVWSFCQDIACGGNRYPYGLPRLIEGKKRKDARGISSGLFGTGAATLQPSLPVNYGSCATMGVGGNNRLFNGKFHETDYPPLPT